jgi:hypothetical protein
VFLLTGVGLLELRRDRVFIRGEAYTREKRFENGR